MHFFTVIIISSDFNENFYQCIKSIENQNFDNYELILVSELNFSSFKLDRFKVRIKYIQSEINNPSHKRNLAIKKARSNYIIFLDDDTVLHKNFFDDAYKIALTGEKIFGGPGIIPKKHSLKQKIIYLSQQTYALGSFYRFQKSDEVFYVDELHTVNLICHKSLFDEFSFDEGFWPGEDTKFFFDLFKHKIKTKFIGNLFVYHHPRPNFFGFFRQVFRYGKNRSRLFFYGIKFSFKKIIYLAPSMLCLYLAFLIVFNLYFATKVIFFPLIIYFLFLLFCVFQSFQKEKSILVIYLFFIIPFIHIFYGLGFLSGIFNKKIYLGR